MKKYFILLAISSICTFYISAQSQKPDKEIIIKKNNGVYRIELIFDNISSKKDCYKIVNSLKSIEGVFDVDLYYPTTDSGVIVVSKNIKVKTIIAKLDLIEIKLNPKSIKYMNSILE